MEVKYPRFCYKGLKVPNTTGERRMLSIYLIEKPEDELEIGEYEFAVYSDEEIAEKKKEFNLVSLHWYPDVEESKEALRLHEKFGFEATFNEITCLNCKID